MIRFEGSRPCRASYCLGLLAWALVFGIPRSAEAQSLSFASLHGSVKAAGGQPLFAVAISATDDASGVTRRAVTDRSGRFHITLLSPGTYQIFAEAVGYRPARVMEIVVVPDNDPDVTIDLVAAPPPVQRVDTSRYSGNAISGRGTGMGQRWDIQDNDAFPDRQPTLSDIVRRASNATEQTTEGSPNSERVVMVDGSPFIPAQHPRLSSDGAETLAFPLLAGERTELLTNPVDVEYAGSGSGYLRMETLRGSNSLRTQVDADWSGAVLSSAKYFTPRSIPHDSWRGGLRVSGPIIRDTASFVFGVEAQRTEAPFAPLLADPAGLSLVSVARDSFSQDLAAYSQPGIQKETAVAGFGRANWQVSANHLVTVRVQGGRTKVSNPQLDLTPFSNIDGGLEARDLNAVSTLTSALGARMSHEVRIGLSTSRREYTSGPPIGTLFPSTGLGVGDPDFAGTFKRTEGRVSDVLHLVAGAHQFKFGVDGSVAAMETRYVPGERGVFIFSDATGLAQRNGGFEQATALLPTVRYTLPRFGAFLQDRLSLGSALKVTVGVRFDNQLIPVTKVIPDDTLEAVTGVSNSDLKKSVARLAPRFAFTWQPGGRGTFAVRGAAAIYTEPIDASALSEVIGASGSVARRSAAGILPDWPSLPDSASAPIRGNDAAVFGPSFGPPRATRATLGISQALGRSAALHLTGTYAHSDFLLRRQDLNLPVAAMGADQYGRPLYGTLRQFGEALIADPGSNHRFGGINHLWAFNSDGYSDYWGATAALERESRSGLRVWASYTYSRTTDNWLAVPGTPVQAQLTPFPAGLNGQDWADGTSDFDVPHHVTAGLAVPLLPRIGAEVGIQYSYHSGRVFTPGFRPGADANADGAFLNDPAYVDPTVAGTTALLASWPCLADQQRMTVARNSCRGPGVSQLDVRLRIASIAMGQSHAQVFVDAFNLLDSADDLLDRAVYRVDATRSLATNATTGVVTIPLVANPNFGHPLTRLSPGRSVRIGLRIAR